MNLDSAVAYYTDLIQSDAPFGEALAWTVIRPLGDPVPLTTAAIRLIGGGHPELVESDEEFTEEAVFLEGKAVYLGQTGTATMLLEPGGFSYAGRPQVMAWLSQDAQVWHLSWNLAGTRGLEYAAHGQWLARIPTLIPDMLHGADPAALEEEAAALQEVADAPWPAKQATAMAIIEARTGARLPMDWFDQPRPVAIIDPLVSVECPPIGLWHYEPDLHARLHLVSQEHRRASLLRVVDLLVESFDLGLPSITRAVRAAHGGEALGVDLLEGVREEWESLGERWAGRGYAVQEENEDAWRRWVAANAIRHSLRSLDDGANHLDGLTYARFALSDGWHDIRAGIRQMIRDASS
ncbi:hypothetical protein GCM10009555_093750 [Acrocarpospora macrocephala]|uniref:Uncharacterized protein n=1 Tax=Acrocarpospora macrocephala TaxID=150177 RepID=A0A5M3WX53_9ACTN|nr:hypothetical protein [Acrocarpospora macrocephala]GES14047.1 hypothetical protein Amac_076440 [Acrocarpospora macrocephala]